MATRLTHERLLEVLNYCQETGEFTWNVYKKCVKRGSLAGSINGKYLKICIDYRVYLAHRLAWFREQWEKSMIIACEKGYL